MLHNKLEFCQNTKQKLDKQSTKAKQNIEFPL